MKKEEMKKQEDLLDEEENEDTQEDEEMEESKKSLDLTDADLDKSLDLLAEMAKSDDVKSRKDDLLEKAQKDGLDSDERDELYSLLGGNAETKESFGDEIVKSFKDNETLEKALDVSDYLDAQHEELCKSLKTLGNRIDTSDSRQHDFNLVLAKAIVETGKMVKSMSERLGNIAEQPARGPKSKGVAAPLQKSFAGTTAPENALSKGKILNTMTNMLHKSENGLAPCGEDLLLATAKYEQTGHISKSLLEDIKQYA